jgi:hypothetical protein
LKTVKGEDKTLLIVLQFVAESLSHWASIGYELIYGKVSAICGLVH